VAAAIGSVSVIASHRIDRRRQKAVSHRWNTAFIADRWRSLVANRN